LWVGELLSDDDGHVTVRVIVDEESVPQAERAGWRLTRYTLADVAVSEAIDIGIRVGNANSRRGFQRRRTRYRKSS
jgi:hypothetical protein